MEKQKLNFSFNEKDKQESYCKKCGMYTTHHTGLAWNHDTSLYLSVLRCEKCKKILKKKIDYESFKEAKTLAKLPS